ncbi:hypothetical protein ETB97_003967 [Aspergillus alliaceus]|uniref:H/ACA ribonucleoprotein complex non-core subunit NAF1 n=1 Tax=Petromyces alliaceus TaxID=209559 RepID=A0A8H6E532_PETAA|nr:hypothetical protein ETB97_003967 [Aspergillus burnettii]
MSDQQPPVQPQHSLEATNEGPPVKRTCMNDTPPIALTPADDGSDFYSTPWVVRTPVESSENMEGATQAQTSAPTATSHSSTLIPGLNLVNDSLKGLQSAKSEPNPSPNTTAGEEMRADTQNHMNVVPTEPQKQEPTLESTKKVEAEQNPEPRTQTEATSQSQTENVQINGTANGSDNAPTTDAMDHDQAEEDEEEHPEWEIDSSPYESSSDDSSTDSSDDSDDDEDYPILSPEEQARILMQAELGSDDEGEGKGKSGGHIRTANEIQEEAPDIPDIIVTPEMKIVHLGHVEAIVENNVLIAANTSGEYQVLESGSLLCLEDRNVVGVVAETLGRVENPLYTIRYPSAMAVEERGLSQGKNVYYVEQHSTFVFTQPLKGIKGSDASNFHDEEIGEDEVEFSDDEAEAEYKRKLKQKRQERKEARNEGGGPARAKKGHPGPSKLSQTELNYDDNAGEDGYTPLARPKNLHEMMGRQEAPLENDGPPARGGFRGGRSRGRVSDRGRGGRGRGGSRDTQHYDRQPYQRPGSDAQPQHTSYSQQQAYQSNQSNTYGMPQPYPSYPSFPQQPQQQPQQQFAQGAVPPAFNTQMPFQQAHPQQNSLQSYPINPAFLAALQQQMQQQQYQQQTPGQQFHHLHPAFLATLQQQMHQQHQQQQTPGQQQQPAQAATMNFDQVKAQLDLLRQLSNGNQGPPHP